MSTKVNIIVPVYADWASLSQNIKSLKKYYKNKDWVKIYYVNDCGPEADVLEKKINAAIRGLKNFSYHRNKQNLGFVKNNNNAVKNIIDKDGEVLLLNSDTKVTKGFLEEMVRVLRAEKSICAVSPRSNNATIWSVPVDGRLANRPSRAYKCYKKLKAQISEKYIAPTAHGFCMLIRRSVIDELGLFDEIYGAGYGEENDFTMRAQKKGYKCATANRAFVFHYESRSFGSEQRAVKIKQNTKILLRRYPEYDDAVQRYLTNLNEPCAYEEPLWWRLCKKTFRILEYGHKNGFSAIFNKAGQHLAKAMGFHPDPVVIEKTTPKLKIWTHDLSNTGASLVLLDILQQWITKNNLPNSVELYYPKYAMQEDDFCGRLQDLGIAPIENDVLDQRFQSGDVVVLNSSSYGQYFFDDLLTNLENGTAQHLFWYIHEDSERGNSALYDQSDRSTYSCNEVTVAERYKNIRQRFKKMIEADKVTIYTPSKNTAHNWQKYFRTDKKFYVMPGRVSIDETDFMVRSKSDFNRVDFAIVGTSPLKGQLSVANALDSFFHEHYQKNPNAYRDFSLNIIGVNNKSTDLYADFLHNTAQDLENVKLHNRAPQGEVYKLLRRTNFTITYSAVESFSMATMEGMAFGHPIIRNESSGQEEQLKPGENGWAVSTRNWWGLVETIEEVLNREKTSNEKLVKMSIKSVEIARSNRISEYCIIDDVNKFLNKVGCGEKK
jgi:GT2 family glycosyltransferase/glycosyltransferase involved in cell wall biosynthesis